ncbi:hypothetical protein LLH03_01820 [bacterium]|nr:hypothetical protein [bacterium]
MGTQVTGSRLVTLTVLFLIAVSQVVWALPDDQLQAVLGQFEARRDAILNSQVTSPYPPDGAWHDTDFALAALYTNQKVAEANEVLCHLKDKLQPVDWHWQMNHLQRIWFLFNHASPFFPGRLTPEAEAALLEIFWNYAHTECRLALTDPEHTWYLWGSENHGAMKWSGFWGTAHILAEAPGYKDRRYDDGTSPAQMAQAWDEFYKRYARERAGKGMLVEIFSGYNKYTLQGWYDMADFAADPILRQRMRSLIDLFWAEWATEQIDGVHGGSKHRIYHGSGTTRAFYGLDMSWAYFGLGVKSRHPSMMCPLTSTYRPPLVVVDLALDAAGRGTYSSLSRRPGLNLQPRPEGVPQDTYVLDPDFGGILRYTYSTPDFVMGTSMVQPRPFEDWSAVSSQNRWEGVIFGGSPDSRLVFRGMSSPTYKTYNSHWSVQSNGVVIVQKLKTAKRGPVGWKVWFSADLKRSERDGWVFAQAPRAYAACRVVRGKYHWEKAADYDEAPGEWLVCEDELSPVLVEVARQSDYADQAAFEAQIVGNALTVEADVIRYQSRGYGQTLTFYADYSRMPEVDGKAYDFRPPKVFDSPFLQSDWNSGIVAIQKDSRKLALNFNE